MDLSVRRLDHGPVHDRGRPVPRPPALRLGQGDLDPLPDLHPVPDGAHLPDRPRTRDAGALDQGAGRGPTALRQLRPRDGRHDARRRVAQAQRPEGEGRDLRRGVRADEGEADRHLETIGESRSRKPTWRSRLLSPGPAANNSGSRAVVRRYATNATRQPTLRQTGSTAGPVCLRSGLRREWYGSLPVMLAPGRAMVAALHGGSLTERHDRVTVQG